MRTTTRFPSRRSRVRGPSSALHTLAALCIFSQGYLALAAGSWLKVAARLLGRCRTSHNVAATSWSHLGRIGMAGEPLGSCAHCGREDTVRARFPDTAEYLVLPALECSSCGARWAGRRLAA
jgi:hypothetical protein